MAVYHSVTNSIQLSPKPEHKLVTLPAEDMGQPSVPVPYPPDLGQKSSLVI
jgi:hypothetical protein